MDNTLVTIFILSVMALAIGTGWLLGVNQSRRNSGNDYYSAYTDGYNAALDDIEKVAMDREKKEKAKKATAKKATPKKKGKK